MGRSLQVLHQLALHTKTLPEKAGKQANYLFWKFEELKKQKTKKPLTDKETGKYVKSDTKLEEKVEKLFESAILAIHNRT